VCRAHKRSAHTRGAPRYSRGTPSSISRTYAFGAMAPRSSSRSAITWTAPNDGVEPIRSATRGEPIRSATRGEPIRSATRGEPIRSATRGEPIRSATRGEHTRRGERTQVGALKMGAARPRGEQRNLRGYSRGSRWGTRWGTRRGTRRGTRGYSRVPKGHSPASASARPRPPPHVQPRAPPRATRSPPPPVA
jgi:hypothetical protein